MATSRTSSHAAKRKVARVMREFSQGTLVHGSTGKPVPPHRPDIARAIALSEARKIQKPPAR